MPVWLALILAVSAASVAVAVWGLMVASTLQARLLRQIVETGMRAEEGALVIADDLAASHARADVAGRRAGEAGDAAARSEVSRPEGEGTG